MTTRAFDLQGNEVFLRIANAICPAEYIEQGRIVASSYMETKEDVIDWQPENMLPTPLSPTGEAPATHYLCSMVCYSNQVAAMVSHIGSFNESWIATEEKALTDNITDSFCICCAPRAEFLAAAGLKVVGE